MIRPLKTVLPLLMLALFLGAATSGLELLHADKSIGKKQNNEQLRIFTGHVHFRQDTIQMFCNEAIFYEEQDRVDFLGNVLINDGHRVIRADKIEYYPDAHLTVCRGQVQIKSKSDSLYADYFTYNFKSQQAYAEQNVFIRNLENNVQIWGDLGKYEPQLKHSYVQSNARLMKIDSAGKDTLLVTAHQIKYFDEKPARAVAIDSVIITQGALKAVCDTAIYYPDEESALLRHNPHVWYEDSQLSGLKIEAKFDSLKIRQIFIEGSAQAKTLADSLTGEQNVLKGKKIKFQIEFGKPKLITATDNASSIYYLTENENNQGTNFATSDTIFVHFIEGELDSIQIKGGAEGVFYPHEYKGEKSFAGQ